MARKRVNLLEGEDDDPMDSGYDRRHERRGGGFVDALMVILFVFVMLGGVGWAGYQFWWLPKLEKEKKIRQAQAKQQEQTRTRLARLRSEAELKKQALMILEQVRKEQAQKSPGAAPPNVKPKDGATVAGEKAEARKGTRRRPGAAGSGIAEKRRARSGGSVRTASRGGASRRGFSYSVQVASCRSNSCANAFLRRLKSKRFPAFKTTRRVRGRSGAGQTTEVRLGSFPLLADAQALADKARRGKISVRVYKRRNRWRVAAGNFRDLEEAAILLDRFEDAGLRGELAPAPRPRAGAKRLYVIRTGRFGSFREASAFRKRVLRAGFSNAVIVRQN